MVPSLEYCKSLQRSDVSAICRFDEDRHASIKKPQLGLLTEDHVFQHLQLDRQSLVCSDVEVNEIAQDERALFVRPAEVEWPRDDGIIVLGKKPLSPDVGVLQVEGDGECAASSDKAGEVTIFCNVGCNLLQDLSTLSFVRGNGKYINASYLSWQPLKS